MMLVIQEQSHCVISELLRFECMKKDGYVLIMPLCLMKHLFTCYFILLTFVAMKFLCHVCIFLLLMLPLKSTIPLMRCYWNMCYCRDHLRLEFVTETKEIICHIILCQVPSRDWVISRYIWWFWCSDKFLYKLCCCFYDSEKKHFFVIEVVFIDVVLLKDFF